MPASSSPLSSELSSPEKRVEHFRHIFATIEEEVGQLIVGQRSILRKILTAFFAGGHVLIESVPGLGKTLMAKSLSQSLALSAKRIQFTPDLMPSDIVGTQVLSEGADGKRYFEFKPGPVFANIVLADEINRATPKTQSAVLEAMEEQQVTVFGETHTLTPPFLVVATQNPVEIEGTYPLPEAQLDRFLLKLVIESPSADEVAEILERTTKETQYRINPVLSADTAPAVIAEMQNLVREVLLAPPLSLYIARLIEAATPSNPNSPVPEVAHYLRYGPSPRGAQALTLGAKVNALLDGRVHVSFEDITDVALSALRHRCLLNFQAEAEGISADQIIELLLKQVPKE